MYIKIKELREKLKKVPEMPSIDDPEITKIAAKATKLLDILNDGYVTERVLSVPREDWLWLQDLICSYWDTGNNFWDVVNDNINMVCKINLLEESLIQAPSLEVSSYV
ncbi:hypothetical protein [Syntrophomonas palmitatica]|uniref:hypothetical protein n=1 Tax=Syntrophomonas palmitatica TaxID=402877 RepID=UPI0006D1EAAE|nr:hypothetical protein [Syntrophomonas palmitatica]